jgi:hypothetical protein
VRASNPTILVKFETCIWPIVPNNKAVIHVQHLKVIDNNSVTIDYNSSRVEAG